MTRIPGGDIGLPLKYLGDLLANAAAWQTWTGAANATEALAKVFFAGEPADNVPSIFAVAKNRPGTYTAEKIAVDAYRHSGGFTLDFYSATPAEDQDSSGDAVVNCDTTVSGVIEDMRDLVAAGEYLNCTRFHKVDDPMRCDLFEVGNDYLITQFAIDWSSA